MPPKKTSSAGEELKKKRTSAPATHAPYKDMIKDAILNLKERNGSSRHAIKKYVLANNNINVPSTKAFDVQINKSIKSGADAGDFLQPKGPSGPVKLAKKDSKTKTAAPTKKTKEPKEKKEPKKETAKEKEKETEKEKEKEKKPTKKAPAKTKTPKKAVAKPKPAPKTRKAPTTAPAVTEKDIVLKKTKSGRVAKTNAPVETSKKKAPAKATTKRTSKKKAAAADTAGDDS